MKEALCQKESGVEIIDFPPEDYMPLKDYEQWRVAVLKACYNTCLPQIRWMQKHMETDEVFVLLQGSCTLLLGGCARVPGTVELIPMKRHSLYVVKKGFWHNHVLDEEGEVLIVENRNTSDANSPIHNLTPGEYGQLQKICLGAGLK